jgi:Raf kinase inhibitor-like YbhB/YbcL family protein
MKTRFPASHCIHWMQIILLGATLNCLPVGAVDTGLPKNKEGDKKEKTIMSMRITSSSFPDNGVIPIRHTCEGHDTSPELIWTEVPEGAKSLVLIMDDPDAPDPAAPKRTWVHWVLYNIPVNTGGLTEAIAATDLPPGALEGLNDWQRTGYGGPCPPVGNHRYFHKLYALDTMLPDLKQPTKAKLEKAMQGHVIAYSELIGRYQKRANSE